MIVSILFLTTNDIAVQACNALIVRDMLPRTLRQQFQHLGCSRCMPFVFQRDMNNIQFLMFLCQVGWRCHIPIAICLILRNILTRRVAPAKEATTSGFILGTKVKGTPQHATTQINLTRRNKRYLLGCTELSALSVSIGIYILHRNREIIFRKLFQLIDTYSESLTCKRIQDNITFLLFAVRHIRILAIVNLVIDILGGITQ